MSRITAISPWSWRNVNSPVKKFSLIAALVLPAALLMLGCAEKMTQVERIREQGEVRIVVKPGPTTYERNAGEEERGLQYELIRLFSAWLGVDFRLTLAGSREQIADMLLTGQADVAASGLMRSLEADDPLAFGPGFQWVTRQVVYRYGYIRPDSLADITPHRLHFAGGALAPDEIERMRALHPDLVLVEHVGKDNLELLEMVEVGAIVYAVAWSNEVSYSRISLPDLRVAFDLSEPEPLGWAVRRSPNDDSLIRAIREFHAYIRSKRQLAGLLERVYAFADSFDYVEARSFVDSYRERLPELKPFFMSAAAEFGFDWRLLAAISYQESHWKNSARSPTGVRGLMMLTKQTAQQLGISDRLDPVLSIYGGAKYLTILRGKIPGRIPEPDRTWFALASYNVGFGHLEDARVITQKNGGDPDSWADVKQHLPLLTEHKWYSQTRFGYARGHEPVTFVENIRKYYAILMHLTYGDNTAQPPPPKQVTEQPKHLVIYAPVL